MSISLPALQRDPKARFTDTAGKALPIASERGSIMPILDGLFGLAPRPTPRMLAGLGNSGQPPALSLARFVDSYDPEVTLNQSSQSSLLNAARGTGLLR